MGSPQGRGQQLAGTLQCSCITGLSPYYSLQSKQLYSLQSKRYYYDVELMSHAFGILDC